MLMQSMAPCMSKPRLHLEGYASFHGAPSRGCSHSAEKIKFKPYIVTIAIGITVITVAFSKKRKQKTHFTSECFDIIGLGGALEHSLDPCLQEIEYSFESLLIGCTHTSAALPL